MRPSIRGEHHERVRTRRALTVAACCVAGCGGGQARTTESLPSGVRPIGREARFHLPLGRNAAPARCRHGLGRRFGAHLELFGEGLVALFPAGIGTGEPRKLFAGRVESARCYGPLVTIDPTGLVLLRPGTSATVGDVFDLWGQPLDDGRASAFSGAVRVYVNGEQATGSPRAIPLRRHDEIVLEVGPYVPPHRAYRFPAGW
jgi:hypothetical protein